VLLLLLLLLLHVLLSLLLLLLLPSDEASGVHEEWRQQRSWLRQDSHHGESVEPKMLFVCLLVIACCWLFACFVFAVVLQHTRNGSYRASHLIAWFFCSPNPKPTM
jgi:hypothetical protein